MAKTSTMIMLIGLLIAVSMAEAQLLVGSHHVDGVKLAGRKAKAGAPLQCGRVYGVEAGDTCDGIIKKVGLNAPQFSAFNPNLVCEDLFAGQWVCTQGKSK